jgi:hypothetical protein
MPEWVKNEVLLRSKILTYARDRGYTKYTSTLFEAWRFSIAGTSAVFRSRRMDPGAP